MCSILLIRLTRLIVIIINRTLDTEIIDCCGPNLLLHTPTTGQFLRSHTSLTLTNKHTRHILRVPEPITGCAAARGQAAPWGSGGFVSLRKWSSWQRVNPLRVKFLRRREDAQTRHFSWPPAHLLIIRNGFSMRQEQQVAAASLPSSLPLRTGG